MGKAWKPKNIVPVLHTNVNVLWLAEMKKQHEKTVEHL